MNRYTKFQNKIWDYYGKYKRDLPWRNTRDPYHIFISEVMLQQTQVGRVGEKYHAFLRAFPDFSSLSQASTSSILKLWQGLGYNRRVLYLHESAKIISKRYHNIVPKEKEILDSLPGIGPATASSLIVFSYNIPLVFIETNIRRVFIHYFFTLISKTGKIHDNEILPLIAKTLPRENPREWYYALMDYGSWLGKTIDNPNKRSAQYSRQTKFEGSHRQLRGKILQLILKEESLTKTKLFDTLHHFISPAIDINTILYQLEKEGFIKQKGQHICIK